MDIYIYINIYIYICTARLRYALCLQTCCNFWAAAVREAPASQHNGGLVEGFPSTPQYHIAVVYKGGGVN